jgi:regulator of replication initiation timing
MTKNQLLEEVSRLHDECELLYRQTYDLECRIKELTDINRDLRTRIILLKRPAVNVVNSHTK